MLVSVVLVPRYAFSLGKWRSGVQTRFSRNVAALSGNDERSSKPPYYYDGGEHTYISSRYIFLAFSF